MKKNILKRISIVGFLLTLGILIVSYWLEFHSGFVPCPLCLLQRIIFICIAVLFLFGIFIARNITYRCTSVLISLFSAIGIGLSARQIWLQWYPPAQSGECGVSLEYLFRIMPAHRVLFKIVNESDECSKVMWSFLHLSLAQWSFIFFVVFFVLGLFEFYKAFFSYK